MEQFGAATYFSHCTANKINTRGKMGLPKRCTHTTTKWGDIGYYLPPSLSPFDKHQKAVDKFQ